MTRRAGGPRFQLPLRRITLRQRREAVFVTGLGVTLLGVCAASLVLYLGLFPPPGTWSADSFLFPALASGFVGFIALMGGLGGLYARAHVAVLGDGVRFTEWTPGNARTQFRTFKEMRAFVTHPLAGAPASQGREAGVVEVVCAGVQPVWFAEGYPLPTLTRLAERVARECGVPWREAPREVVPVGLLRRFRSCPVEDVETADVEGPPPPARYVVQRTPGILIVTWPRGIFRAVVRNLFPIVWFLLFGLGLCPSVPRYPAVLPLALLLVGLAVLLIVWAIRTGSQRLLVGHRGLALIWKVPLRGWRQREWRAEDMAGVRAERLRRKARRHTHVLVLYLRTGRAVVLGPPSPAAEVRWLASTLRRELGVPAVVRPVVEVSDPGRGIW